MWEVLVNKKNKTVAALKPDDIRYLLGLSARETDKLIRSGEFPVVFFRGGIRIPAEPFYDWYEYTCGGGAA